MDFDGSTSTQPPSVKVTRTVADAEDADYRELPLLNSVIDVAALDSVFYGRDHGSVMFDYHGYTVTVQNGAVVLEKPPPSATLNAGEDDTPDAYVTSFDSSPESVFLAVVLAVSDVSEAEPTALPPLYSVVDPDALDALVTPTGSSPPDQTVSVSFVFDEHPVTVTNDGVIAVQRPEPAANTPLGTHDGT